MAVATAIKDVIKVWDMVAELFIWGYQIPRGTNERASQIRDILRQMLELAEKWGEASMLGRSPGVRIQVGNLKRTIDSIHKACCQFISQDTGKRFASSYTSRRNSGSKIDAEIKQLKRRIDTCYLIFAVYTKIDNLVHTRLHTQVAITRRPSMESVDEVVSLYSDEDQDTPPLVDDLDLAQTSDDSECEYALPERPKSCTVHPWPSMRPLSPTSPIVSHITRSHSPATSSSEVYSSILSDDYVPSIMDALENGNYNAVAAALAQRSMSAWTETVTTSTESYGSVFFARSERPDW